MAPASLFRLVLLGACWGSSFMLIELSLRAFAPTHIVFGRLMLGAVFVAAVVAVRRFPLPPKDVWGHLLVAAITGNVVPFTLLAVGQQYTISAFAGLAMGAAPLLTLGLATLALADERATRAKAGGLALGFAGLVLLLGPWQAEGSSTLAGQLACVGAAVSYAVCFVYIRRFLAPRKLPAMTVACGQLGWAALLSLAGLAVVAPDFSAVSAQPLLALLALGAVSTGFAYVLLNRLILDEGATPAAVVNYIVPLFAVLFGVGLLGEALHWNMLAGGAVVILGLAVADGRIRKLLGKWRSGKGQPAPADPPVPAATGDPKA